jgi:hypothetical protein
VGTKDDVKADLREAYPGFSRPDVEKILEMLRQAPAGHAGSSVGAALEPVFPQASSRLVSASDGDQTSYLLALKGACVATLQSWPDAADAKPDLARIEAFVDEVEGDG